MNVSTPLIGPAAQVLPPDILSGASIEGFVRLAYQRDPWRVVWALRSDGVLCGMTYRSDQDVFAWHRHPRPGQVRDIAVIPAPRGGADDLWCLTERQVGSTTRRFIELMDEPHRPASASDTAGFVYLDAALSYEGPPATTFSGLSHLEGLAVSVVADGVDIGSRVVSGGQVVLDEAAAVVHVGLPFTAVLECLPLSHAGSERDPDGRVRSVPEVRVLVRETIGGQVGRAEDRLEDLLDRQADDSLDRPPALTTGFVRVPLDASWQEEGRVILVQGSPYPMTVEAILPLFTRGGR